MVCWGSCWGERVSCVRVEEEGGRGGLPHVVLWGLHPRRRHHSHLLLLLHVLLVHHHRQHGILLWGCHHQGLGWLLLRHGRAPHLHRA